MRHHTRDKLLALPKGYRPFLNLIETEAAIKFVKDRFETRLARALNLIRVSAPLAVLSGTGVNDHLNGTERPVRFRVKDMKKDAEIVQSLAKWKRAALHDYGLKYGEGLYTDMNAVRPDETLDNLHSLYVDQWDWERVIHGDDRTIPYLKSVVRKIYGVVKNTEHAVCEKYSSLPRPVLPKNIFFIHSEELEKKYPRLTPQQREAKICKEKGAVFIIGIGFDLKDGRPHDGRAADYDDWWTLTSRGRHGLNGDIIIWYPMLNAAFELSSMGIRVDKVALENQCRLRGESAKLKLEYHKRLLRGELPLSIGGGIGQSRLCMFFLRKAHIGEVHAGIWPSEMKDNSKKYKVELL